MQRIITMSDGSRIHATVDGAGTPILFVHADFVDGDMWSRTMAALKPRYTVASYDKRGFGSSDAAEGAICRRRELEAVLRALDLAPAHLVGCSNGGQSSLDLALEKPELVASLTLVNSTPSGFVPQGEPPAELREMISAFQEGDIEKASDLQIRIWFDGPERRPEGLDSERIAARAEAARMNKIFIERGTFFIADASPAEPLDPPAILRLGEVAAPTLVVSGALDYSENRRASRILAEGIPKARFVRIEGCAHVPPLEASGEFARVLGTFLDSLSS